jgi:type I restriction-modification system DNA methylase subunit
MYKISWITGGGLCDIAIYGQESNPTTLRLAKMNLAIRGIDTTSEFGDTFFTRSPQRPESRFYYG